MKPYLRCSTLLSVALVFGIASCKLGKSNDDLNAGNSGDQIARKPSYVSCRSDVEGVTQRCVQYDSANSNPVLIDWLKSACGKAENGFAGYVYSGSGCPADARLGECVANHPAAVYSDYYYSPKYTAETAAKTCQDSDGSWTTP